jgi:hypothetical protein
MNGLVWFITRAGKRHYVCVVGTAPLQRHPTAPIFAAGSGFESRKSRRNGPWLLSSLWTLQYCIGACTCNATYVAEGRTSNREPCHPTPPVLLAISTVTTAASCFNISQCRGGDSGHGRAPKTLGACHPRPKVLKVHRLLIAGNATTAQAPSPVLPHRPWPQCRIPLPS